jgi:glycosyltransferase involved in cell wall biosynthesis
MDWYVPGLGYQENLLPAEQLKLGHDVQIVTSDRIPDYIGYSGHLGKWITDRVIGHGTFEEHGVKIHRLPCSELGQVFMRGLGSELRLLRPEVVHAHGPFQNTTLKVVMMGRKIGYRIYIDDHSHERNLHFDDLATTSYLAACSVFYRLFDSRVEGFLAVTESSQQILRTVFKIPGNRIRMLYLGASTERFYRSAELRRRGRQEIGAGDDSIILVSSGKFDESKDIHILLQAFKLIAEDCPQAILLLVGGGPESYMRSINRIITENNLGSRVIQLGFVMNKDLPVVYNAADIGVWPGDHSITAIEALATGLPIIVPTNDLAYRILFNHHSAQGFPRGEVKGLYQVLKFLIDDSSARRTQVDNALSLVSSQLSWSRIAQRSTSLYSSGRFV